MYLLANSDGVSIVAEITNTHRKMVDNADGDVVRFENGKFQSLAVDMTTAEEGAEGATEIDGDFYTIGEDGWVDVNQE